MTDLYQRNGSPPDTLPSTAYAENGDAYTAPYEADDLAMLSFVRAPAKPGDTETQTAEWDAEAEAWMMVARPPAPGPDMPSLRARALAAAMTYGNAITSGEINQWAGVEPLSWTQQRDEAIVIRDGGTLDNLAVLPGLAEDKGITLAAYAEDVLANAMRYQTVLRAAVYLRRHATSVLNDETIDTPAKLADAVAMLQAEADRLAAQLLGG